MEVRWPGQSIWGWKVVLYLFLAGLGAGAYATGVISDFMGKSISARIGIALGAPLVAIGSLFLIWDLGQSFKFYRATSITGIKTSWIARGFIILSIFIALGIIHIATWIWPFNWLENMPLLRSTLDVVNGIFALLTMIYTGILLGAVKPIPLWSNPILPLLFLVSALSTGIMGISLLISAAITPMEETFLLTADMILIALESLVIFFYLQATHATAASRASASLLMTGSLAPYFWGGVVLIGLIIPFFAEFIQYRTGSFFPMVLLGYSLGILGGLFLRHVIVAAGIKAPLNVAGILVQTPSKDRF